MEDKQESGEDAAVEENTMLIDAEEGKARPVPPIEESPSQAMHDQNKKSPSLEGSEASDAKLVEEHGSELPHSRDDHRPAEIAKAHLKDSGKPDIKDLEPPSKGDGADKQRVLDPSIAITSDTDHLDGSAAHQNHPDSITTEDHKGGELDNEGNMVENLLVTTNENETNNRTESAVRNETEKKNSNMGMAEHALASKVERRKEDQNNAVTQMKLVPDNERKKELNSNVTGMELGLCNQVKEESEKMDLDVQHDVDVKTPSKSFLLEPNAVGNESGTKEEQAEFFKELETFHKDNFLEFKPPRFYGEPLNLLKLWRAVIKLGGYEQATSCKLWRQVGESFKPPKTCTTVSWTFRCFYEKALLEYEKHKMCCGELPFNDAPLEPASGNQVGLTQASGSGRARRDAAARAMQGWHSQRLLGNGEVGDPIIKDKNSTSTSKREKQLTSIGLLKRKRPSPVERAVKVARSSKPHLDTMVVDIGTPADWVKINVHRTKDCFEVYALVPGLLREEVHVQSDPAGRLVISGQPEQTDNPWGVTPFKKVVSLPSRIDPHQTSAVVTLHGQLFVRVPFEQSDL